MQHAYTQTHNHTPCGWLALHCPSYSLISSKHTQGIETTGTTTTNVPSPQPTHHVLALHQIDAPQPLIRQVAVVAALAHGDHQRGRPQHLLYQTGHWHGAALPHVQRRLAPLPPHSPLCHLEELALRVGLPPITNRVNLMKQQQNIEAAAAAWCQGSPLDS